MGRIPIAGHLEFPSRKEFEVVQKSCDLVASNLRIEADGRYIVISGFWLDSEESCAAILMYGFPA